MMTDCNNPTQGQFNSMDRLSNLPDFIIDLIVSYMGTKEAYRTSVLSKRWNQIFATSPILDFYRYHLPMEKLPGHFEYIDTRMQKYSKENLRITELTLNLPTTDLELACKVDEWFEIAVRNQVANLCLSGLVNYKLPSFLFRAKSLRCLDCRDVEIPYYEALDLVSLEFLSLHQAVVEERMLSHIVNSCLLLKELYLSDCSGYTNLVIPRHSKLEYLFIDADGARVILETSSLRSFQYIPYDENNPWPIISNRGLLRNLRHLLVTSVCITDKALAELLPELALLEKLEFSYCHVLTKFKISNTQLKQIFLYHCNTLLNVVIDAPCLKEFNFDGEINPSLSITIRSQANCNIHVQTVALYFDTRRFFKLKKFLKGLNKCNVLKILLHDASSESDSDDDDGDGGDIEFVEEESGNAVLGPLCDIGKLELDLSHWVLSDSSISAFLNGLFWICHPDIISLRVVTDRHNLIVKLRDDMVKCARHPLKRIEVVETNWDSYFIDVQMRLYW